MNAAEDKQVKVTATSALLEFAPPDYVDPVIEAYKKDVDRTLLRENLKLSVEQRLRNAENFHKDIETLREAGRQMRLRSTKEGACQRGRAKCGESGS